MITIQIIENVKDFISEQLEKSRERDLRYKNVKEKRRNIRKVEGMLPIFILISIAISWVAWTALGFFEILHFYAQESLGQVNILNLWRNLTVFGYIWLILLISIGISFLFFLKSEMKINRIYERIYGLHPLGFTRRYYQCAECGDYFYEHELKYASWCKSFSCPNCGHLALTKHSGAKPN